jgi:DMSO/TMAO reductase YedYZ molybdopterin-dependent catalytic subunit
MKQDVSRRTMLKGGGAALAGLTVLRVAGPAHAFEGPRNQRDHGQEELQQLDGLARGPRQLPVLGEPGAEVVPWLDQPTPTPFPGAVDNLLVWEDLESWYTPTDNFFYVTHYPIPTILESDHTLGLAGLVARPRSFTLEDLKALPRHEVDFTLECSGNTGTGLDFAIGAVGNARWAGARLAPLLEHAGPLDEATEVIFWGADSGTVTIRDNSGIVSAGQTGIGTPDADGGIDLTITEQFARSMSLRDALARDNLLCYEMNGDPLPREHGFPLRLIAPGWYGVANVKWLTRIEVVDRRFAGRFMARDYVSIREETRNGETLWTFATVGRDRLKSAPAKVTRLDDAYTVWGAAWGAPIAAVEVRIDDGPWNAAELLGPRMPRGRSRGYAWTFWKFAWGAPAAGEHRVTSRAFDVEGNVQPPPDDPFLASRRTYWESNGHITRIVQIT